MSAISTNILTKGSDFVSVFTQLEGQGAVFLSRWDHTDPQRLCNFTHLKWRGISGQINIRGICHHHSISNTTTNVEQLKTSISKTRKYRC